MLFFTQCFGAVLDLIHLRFQHNKAKRVFSAAGQLVCVVNPTHDLKVSGWLPFDVPVARGSGSSPSSAGEGGGGGGVASGTLPRSPGRSRQRSSLCYIRRCWAPGARAGLLLPLWVCGCSRDGVFPCLAGETRVSVYFFYPTLSA